MNPDIALVERAAKAAGIEVRGIYSESDSDFFYADIGEVDVVEWNSLTNFDDTLNLEISLKFTAAWEPMRGGWSIGAIVNGEFKWLSFHEDRQRATTMAAAAIEQGLGAHVDAVTEYGETNDDVGMAPVIEKLHEYSVKFAHEYPDIEKVAPWEQLYALVSVLEGTLAANEDLHKLLKEKFSLPIEIAPNSAARSGHTVEAGPSATPIVQPVIGGDGAIDPLYQEAIAIVRKHARGSISLVQRHLLIGYNRASCMLEAMEADGIITPWGPGGSGREIILPGCMKGSDGG